MNFRWSESASEQLVSIFDYIALHSADAALRVIQRIEASVERAARMPYSGRTGRISGTRELPVPGMPYVVIYEIKDDIIYVLAIWHGAQDWPKPL